MKKIGKIILLVLGVALIALAIKGIAEIPAMNEAMEAAVYLEEPVVLSENEGKLVILHGKPEMTAPVCDEELGLTLNTIKAIRYASEYRLASENEGKETYKWAAQGSRSLTGQASIGGFALDSTLLNAFGAEQEYHAFDAAQLSEKGYVTDFEGTTQSSGTDRLYVIVGGSMYYEPFESNIGRDASRLIREADEEIIRERVGAKAYAYRIFADDSGAEWTVAGIQQGSTLVADETLGPVVRSGVATREELLKANGNATLFGAIAFGLLGVVCLLLGLRKPKVQTYTYYDKEQANK